MAARSRMLGCAEVIAKFAPQTPVGFVAFNCEEDGMVGSADFVDSYLSKAEFSISADTCLEMVGFASTTLGSQLCQLV